MNMKKRIPLCLCARPLYPMLVIIPNFFAAQILKLGTEPDNLGLL